MGRIRSVGRVIRRSDGGHGTTVRLRGRVLRPAPDASGHLRVALCPGDGRQHTKKVHRLVLEAFVGPCPDGMECCHANGDPADNRLANLRWDTPASNTQDRIRHGVHNMSRRGECAWGHLLAPPNLASRERGWRQCLACVRARGARHRRGESLAWFVADANRRYAEIMAGASDPLGPATSQDGDRDATRSEPVRTRTGSGLRPQPARRGGAGRWS